MLKNPIDTFQCCQTENKSLFFLNRNFSARKQLYSLPSWRKTSTFAQTASKIKIKWVNISDSRKALEKGGSGGSSYIGLYGGNASPEKGTFSFFRLEVFIRVGISRAEV